MLVQFDGRNNIGWYDIDIDYLRVVDQPLPKEEPHARRTAASKKPQAPESPVSSEAGVPPVDATPTAARKEPAPAKTTAETSVVEEKRDGGTSCALGFTQQEIDSECRSCLEEETRDLGR